ncbi:MAG: (d)CMP kinase [Muribaculaceae bacterium]|nr:(d)CMP kinase [Muribaculaceae bacterium]
MKIIVAIDGFAASGKSTIAQDLAEKTGYTHIDSGAMYRAVTLFGMQKGLVTSSTSIDSKKLIELLPTINISFDRTPENYFTMLNGKNVEKEIRSLAVSNLTPHIAKIVEVRNFLTARLREMGKNKGVVMEGRDIGTVVFPDAKMKVFVTAPLNLSVERRLEELKQQGNPATYQSVEDDILERDKIDSAWTYPAKDAIRIENGAEPLSAIVQHLFSIFESLTAVP